MSWELAGRGDWAQWVDRPSALGWIDRCRALLSAPPPQESTREAYAAQARWTVDAYRALAGVALSIDMPLSSFRPYAQAQRERDTGTDIGTGLWRGDTWRIARDTRNPGAITGDQGYLDLWYRVNMSIAGDVTDSTSDVAPPDSALPDVDGWGHNCNGVETAWSCMNWKYDELTLRTDVVAIVPLRWHYELALSGVRMVSGYATLGDLVEDSRAYVQAQNLATLRELQRNDPAAFDEGDILSAAADVEAAHWRGDAGTDAIAAIGDAAASAAPSSVGAGVKAAIKGVTLIPQLLLEIFGHASQHPRDLWGRTLPLVETACLSGQLDPPRAPSHTPPAPPPVPTLVLQLPAVQLVDLRPDRPVAATSRDVTSQRSGSDTGLKIAGAALLAALLLRPRRR